MAIQSPYPHSHPQPATSRVFSCQNICSTLFHVQTSIPLATQIGQSMGCQHSFNRTLSLYFCLFNHLSTCLSFLSCLWSIFLLFCLPTHFSVCLSLCLLAYLPAFPYFSLSVSLSARLSDSVRRFLSANLSLQFFHFNHFSQKLFNVKCYTNHPSKMWKKLEDNFLHIFLCGVIRWPFFFYLHHNLQS